jgi:hypothetical protein
MQLAKGSRALSLVGCLVFLIGGFVALKAISSMPHNTSLLLVLLAPILILAGGVTFFIGRLRRRSPQRR